MTKLRSFHVPHDRVTYKGLLENLHTGELTQPERRVKQSFKDECDINNIMKHFSVTGQVQHISAKAAQGAYLDLPDEVDFQHSMNIVAQANEAFASLPSKVRDRFNNDPAKFLEFMSLEENQDEAIKLGLATRRPDSAPDGGGNTPPPPSPPPAAPPPAAEPPK